LCQKFIILISLRLAKEKLRRWEKIARDHMNNPMVHMGLSLVLDKLFESPSRRKEEDEMQHDDKEMNRIVLEEQTDKHVLIDLGCQKEEEIKDEEEKINESVSEEEETSDVWIDNVNDTKKGISPFFCCLKKDWNFSNCCSRIMKSKYHKEKGGNTDGG
jgi:hypothetical protein